MEALIERILGSAVIEMWRRDPSLGQYTSGSRERETNVASHYAHSVRDWLPWLNWDSDLIKPHARERRPDLVFHLRGVHAENFLAIEIKRQKYSAAAKADLAKFDADWFRAPYDYQYGASIVLDDTSAEFALRVLTRTAPGKSSVRPEFGKEQLMAVGAVKSPRFDEEWNSKVRGYILALRELEEAGLTRAEIKIKLGEPILYKIRQHYG